MLCLTFWIEVTCEQMILSKQLKYR